MAFAGDKYKDQFQERYLADRKREGYSDRDARQAFGASWQDYSTSQASNPFTPGHQFGYWGHELEKNKPPETPSPVNTDGGKTAPLTGLINAGPTTTSNPSPTPAPQPSGGGTGGGVSLPPVVQPPPLSPTISTTQIPQTTTPQIGMGAAGLSPLTDPGQPVGAGAKEAGPNLGMLRALGRRTPPSHAASLAGLGRNIY